MHHLHTLTILFLVIISSVSCELEQESENSTSNSFTIFDNEEQQMYNDYYSVAIEYDIYFVEILRQY